ncbi:hypothetical protein JB92DRAFT_3221934 [Gautieria morchelliformis]|nr:hypothetical protein JB92DRAFT_3221934 [Gautieria morchelliformis]
MACTIQAFLPEAVLMSCEVSRAFLTTRHGNLMCQLHGKFAKKRVNIPEGSRGHWITGMDINGRCMGKSSKQAIPRGEGFCHCGCDEDAVLFEFAMWKRWRVLVPGDAPGAYLAESLRGQVMDPRMHIFVKAAYERDTGLGLSDWWAESQSQREAAHAWYEKAVRHFQEKLRNLDTTSDGDFVCADG